jgi:hypothetical protein
MKLFTFAACLLMAASMMAQGAAGIKVDPVHSSGAFASVFTFTNNSDINLNVTRSDNNGSTTTFLNFDVFTFTADGFTDIFAFGQVPNDSLKGDNTKHLSLNVDTSQTPSFQITTCTFSFATFTFTCQPGQGGVVQLEFQQDGNFSNRTISDQHSTFFQVDIHNHVNSDSASAFANGSVLGIPVNNGFSSIGTNHDTTITLTSTH